MDQSEPGDLRCRGPISRPGMRSKRWWQGRLNQWPIQTRASSCHRIRDESFHHSVQVCFVCGGDTIPLVVQFAHAGHERFHSSGFVQGIELGCERSQMTSGPSDGSAARLRAARMSCNSRAL